VAHRPTLPEGANTLDINILDCILFVPSFQNSKFSDANQLSIFVLLLKCSCTREKKDKELK